MSELLSFPDGGFAFLKGVFPYSQGVVALPGHAIERVRLLRPLPVAAGFDYIAAYLEKLGRPRTAFCACELRSPQPFSFSGFGEFNQGYVAVLERWGLFRDGVNPVARSNVAPVAAPPAEPCFHAFSYTVPAAPGGQSFVVAGSGEWPEGGRFPEDIVARGDVSPGGLRSKAEWVLAMMESRMRGLGVTWAQASVAQLYTACAMDELMPELQKRIQPASLTWHYCRPPIEGLEYEMDVRGVSAERLPA